MYCIQCGAKIKDNSAFCEKCGAKQCLTITNIEDEKICPRCHKLVPNIAKCCPYCHMLLAFSNNDPMLYEDIETPENIVEKNEINHESIIKKVYQKWWFMWLMLVLFLPVGLFLLWKKQNYTFKKKTIISVVFIGIVGISLFSMKSPEEKYNDALKLTSAGQYTEALKELKSVSTDKAIKLQGELKIAINNPQKKQEEIAAQMSDEEFKSTKAGTNTKEYFSNPDINKYFLTNIAKMSDSYHSELVENAIIQAEAERKNEIREKFEKTLMSSWDGSNRALERYIKANMNDPKSYEHIETRYSINYDKGVAVLMTKFRGKNAFGGVVVNACVATQDINSGKLLSTDFIK